jgi:hypothetical protein
MKMRERLAARTLRPAAAMSKGRFRLAFLGLNRGLAIAAFRG